MKFFKFSCENFKCLYNKFDFYILYKQIIPEKYSDIIQFIIEPMIINKLFVLVEPIKNNVIELSIDALHPNVNPYNNRIPLSKNYKEHQTLKYDLGDFLKTYQKNNLYFDPNIIEFQSADGPVIYYLDFGNGWGQYYIIEDEYIIPQKAWYKGVFYQIHDLNPTFYIKKIKIIVKDNFIESVYLDSPHPNSDLTTNEYCLPPIRYYNKPFNKELYKCLKEDIKTYNLNNPHYHIWNYMNLTKELEFLGG